MATSLSCPSCIPHESAPWKPELTAGSELHNWTADKSAEPERKHICVFLRKLSRVQIRKAILTERRQGGDPLLRVREFGVLEHTGEALPLVLRCREDGRVFLSVRIRAGLNLHIFSGGWLQVDIGFWSTSGRDARDHPEVTSSSFFHVYCNGHIWLCCKAGRTAEQRLSFLGPQVVVVVYFSEQIKKSDSKIEALGVLVIWGSSSRMSWAERRLNTRPARGSGVVFFF